MQPTTTRLQQIAAMYAEHNDQLKRLVARRASTDPQTIEDACSHAWTQLLTHPDVDLTPPHWRSLAWLTQTAVREAWRLDTRQRTTVGATDDALGHFAADRGASAPSTDELAAQHARLDLVGQIPERPRRFLLRLMLGYSYEEIATQEGVTHTSTNKQIARAKHLLREIETRENTDAGGEDDPPPA